MLEQRIWIFNGRNIFLEPPGSTWGDLNTRENRLLCLLPRVEPHLAKISFSGTGCYAAAVNLVPCDRAGRLAPAAADHL